MKRAASFLLIWLSFLALAAHAFAQQARTVIQPVEVVEVARSPKYLAIEDFNLDGLPDVVASSPTAQKVTVLLSDGFGGVDAAIATSPIGGSMRAVAAGDLDMDGIPDVAVTDPYRNQTMLLLGNGDGSLGSPTSLAGKADPFGVAIGEFDGLAGNDIAVGNARDDDASVFFNLGTGRPAFSRPTNFSVGNKPSQVIRTDLNGDFIDDIATLNIGSTGADDVTVLLGDGFGDFVSRGNFVAARYSHQMTVGDFNNDGINDMAVVSGLSTTSFTQANGFTVMLNDGFGFLNRSEYVIVDCVLLVESRCMTNGIAAGDFDLDGNVDLAVLISGAKKILLYAGSGNGTFFQTATILEVDAAGAFDTHFLLAADFDQDGRTDLVSSAGTRVQFFQNLTEFPVFPTPLPTSTVTPTQPGPSATPTPTPTSTATRTPKQLGDPCAAGAECGSAFCVDEVCCENACDGPFQNCNLGSPGSCQTYPPSTVTPSIPQGDSCGGEQECVSGFCVDDVCCNRACDKPNERCDLEPPGICQTLVTPTATRTRTGTIAPTATPTPGKPLGDPCARDPECASGYCVDGVCCDSACDGPLESCNLDPPGFCQTFPTPTGTATPGKAIGDDCLSDPECESGFCVDDVCCESACDAVDERCDLDPPGFCQFSSFKRQGDPCGSDSECESGFCTDGRCCDRRCDGLNESCDLVPPGLCQANPPGTPTDGGGALVARSGGCSTGGAGDSPLTPLTVVLVPLAFSLVRRRVAHLSSGPRHRH